MPEFQVRVISKGQQSNLTITADNDRLAQKQAENDGHTVVDIIEIERPKTTASTSASGSLKPDRTPAYVALGVGMLFCLIGFMLLYVSASKGTAELGFAMPLMLGGLVIMGASTRWMFRN